MKKVAVVPVYNEARHLLQVLETFGARMDVTIAVNDGSKDESASILADWIARQPRCYVVDNPVNRGKASALRDGFSLAALLVDDGVLESGDLLYTFDADGQHTVDSIDRLAELTIQGDLDMLLTRRDFSHYPRFKKVGNWGLSMFASILGGYRYRDVECGLRVIRVGRLAELLSYYNGYKYSCEQELGIIAAALGYRLDNSYLVEVPYYRAGTKVPDGLINVSLGFVAWLRLMLGLRSSRAALARRLADRRILAGPGSPIPSALRTALSGRPAPTPLPLKTDR
ncbi:MAG TPA: glycosyltransferase family 2 protein [Candidatus Polarisedimenticolia bacterium]|nr:glycosyltransferase family 2 protein [Candidatus Polarisedimenticolia bacterium]